jgi:type IV pilus assembly protein PilV
MLPKNSNGFTMVEVMVATVIILVGLLGLLQAVNLAMETNLRNQLRDEAIYVGERVINEQRGRGFDSISTTTVTTQVPSRIRGSTRTYSVTRSATVLSTTGTPAQPDVKRLQVVVNWTYRKVAYENRVAATISTIR